MHYKDTYDKANKARRMLKSGKYTKQQVRKKLGIGSATLWRWMVMVEGPIEPPRRTWERKENKAI